MTDRSRELTAQESAVLVTLFRLFPGGATSGELAERLSGVAGRAIPWQVVMRPAAALAGSGLVTRSYRRGRQGRSEVIYQATRAGRSLADMLPLPQAADFPPSSAPPRRPPAPLASFLSPPRHPGRMWTGVRPGQVWSGAIASMEGRRIEVTAITPGTASAEPRVLYRVLTPASRSRHSRSAGSIMPSSLRAVYRLESSPDDAAPPLPAARPLTVHLMVTDPDDPGRSDIFTRCCGLNWQSMTERGDLIAGLPALATCPGRPVAP